MNMGHGVMKTTVEIPDSIFRGAKAKAAERGQALRKYVTEALQEKLSGRPSVTIAQTQTCVMARYTGFESTDAAASIAIVDRQRAIWLTQVNPLRM